nr:TATA-box-binding protein [Halorientalis regularis]
MKELNLDIVESYINDSTSTEFIVLQGDLGGHIKLNDAIEVLEGQTEYEPEQFPAVIYRPRSSDCTATIFSTGKVSITGVRHQSTAEKIYDQIKSSLAV